MKCPECGAWSAIKETRTSPTFGYMRRRECGNEHRFTTQETIIPPEILEQERYQQRVESAAKGRAKAMALRKGRRRVFTGLA